MNMITKPTKVVRWNVSCLDNGHKTTTYTIFGDGYGQLVGRTPKNELALLNAWEGEKLFLDSIGKIVTKLLDQERGTSECFQAVLGVACDPSPSDHIYCFTGKIWCPICGSTNLKYGPDEPPVIELFNLKRVSHLSWDKLSPREQQNLIDKALRDVGCKPWDSYLKNIKTGQLRDL